MDAVDFIRTTLAPLAGKRVLDIGCGKGALAAALSADGAQVTGVDPASTALDEARRAAPAATFEVASAEALPFAPRAFDAAILLNALHHVPVATMGAALVEASRVTEQGGCIIVIEPLITGSFNAVLKLIDDETDIRAAAQAAVQSFERDPAIQPLSSITFTRKEFVPDFAGFIVRATSADPSRLEVVARRRAEIEDAFRQHAVLEGAGRYRFDQPLKADAFRVR